MVGAHREAPPERLALLEASFERLGEAVDETTGMMRPVPPIALNTDRLFQRAVASLLFARPSEIDLEEVIFTELIYSALGGAGSPKGTFGRVRTK